MLEFLLMRPSGEQLAKVAALVDGGIIRPVVGKVVSLDQVPDALSSLGQGGLRGKAVATVTD